MSSTEDKPLTGVKKRQEIDKTRKQLFVWVAVASAAVVVCITVGINLFHQIQYQSKVNGELGKTEKTMKNNVTNSKKVIQAVDKLRTNEALASVNKPDGSNVFQVVLDAMPTSNDAVALSSSIQSKILEPSTGVTINSINVESTGTGDTGESTSDDASSSSSSSSDASFPTAQSINFTVSMTGSSEQIDNALKNIEKTIRPIDINSINIQGTDSKLEVTLNCTTYYTESVKFKLGEKTVNYEEK